MPNANKAFSDEIVFLAPTCGDQGRGLDSSPGGAENRKQLRSEVKAGEVDEVAVVAAGVDALNATSPSTAGNGEISEVDVKELKHRIGLVGVVNP